MKTAVSIPDNLFRSAEKEARRQRVSRSRLYAEALSDFLRRKRREGITDALNRVYDKEPSGLDPVLAKIQALSLEKEDW